MGFGLDLCFCGENKWRAVWLFSVARMASGAGCGFKILVWVCGLYFFGAWLRCGGRAGRIWFVCAVRLKSRAIWLVAKSVARVKIWAWVALNNGVALKAKGVKSVTLK